MSGTWASSLTNIWNEEVISNKRFLNGVKLAIVTPVFRKEESTLLKNYRPVTCTCGIDKM